MIKKMDKLFNNSFRNQRFVAVDVFFLLFDLSDRYKLKHMYLPT